MDIENMTALYNMYDNCLYTPVFPRHNYVIQRQGRFQTPLKRCRLLYEEHALIASLRAKVHADS